MVSFSCDACGDVITKKGLDKHRNQCRWASFTCLDCMVHFEGTSYRSHTSCISEAEKYQGQLYRAQKSKTDKRKSLAGKETSQEMIAKQAYVEDAPEGEDSQAMVIVDVPPKAPTPPPASAPVAELPDSVNVFDFLVSDDGTPSAPPKAVQHIPDEQRMVEHPVHYGNGDYNYPPQFPNGNGVPYMNYGFAYGNTPVAPSYSRYDSWPNLADTQALTEAPFITPAPKELRREKKAHGKHVSISESSEKKRKRHQIDELDLSSAGHSSSRDYPMTDAPADPRVLHSGLTGGLTKLVTDPEFYEDRIDAGPTPVLSPMKRSRREEDTSKAHRRKSSRVDYNTITVRPSDAKTPSHEKYDRKNSSDAVKHDRVSQNDTNGTRTRRTRSPERTTAHTDKPRRRPHSNERVERKYHDDRHRHNHQQPQTRTRYRDSLSSEDRPHRKHLRAIDYPPDSRQERPLSVQPHAMNQIVMSYKSRADLFMSFVNKGPESDNGYSINKVLKRYHRERDVRGGEGKEEENKELWKALRLRRNDRGEIVLFV